MGLIGSAAMRTAFVAARRLGWRGSTVECLVGVVISLVRGVGSILGIQISFDLNRFFENRRDQQKERLRALCGHTIIYPSEEGLRVESLFKSPPMTIAWICSRCGTTTSDRDVPERVTRYWAENPDEWNKQEGKFLKQARKLGLY